MNTTKQRPNEIGFFDLPAELRIMVYSALQNSSRQGRLAVANGSSRQGPLVHGNILCPSGFKANPQSQEESSQHPLTEPCPIYQQFLSAKLISKQFRQEYLPIWYHAWSFHLPRPLKCPDNFYAAEDDSEELIQLIKFLQIIGDQGTSSLRHLKLAYRLRSQTLPEASVGSMEADKLRDMLCQASRGHLLNSNLVVNFEVQCSGLLPSNKRAAKDVLFRRNGMGWRCICDSGIVVSYGRTWD